MQYANGNEALRETEARRLQLLDAIGTKRKSFVIAYLTSTRPGVHSGFISDDDMHIIENHVRAARSMGAQNIDMVLVTYGGHSVAPWGIIAMIREHFPAGGFRVIVPSVAYSAGTGICLGADEIVMGPGSILGPTDTQYYFEGGTGERWISASDFRGFLEFIKDRGLSGRSIRERTLDWFTAHMDAASVGALFRLGRENKRKILKLLGSRRPPLTASQNDRVAEFLLYGIGSHGQSIRRTEARQNGLSFITDIEKSGVEQEVWELFRHYADILQLDTPHARPTQSPARREGDEFDYDAYGRHFTETPVAVVESPFDTNPAYTAYALRHWNTTPPLNLEAPADAPAPGKRRARAADAAPARWVSVRENR